MALFKYVLSTDTWKAHLPLFTWWVIVLTLPSDSSSAAARLKANKEAAQPLKDFSLRISKLLVRLWDAFLLCCLFWLCRVLHGGDSGHAWATDFRKPLTSSTQHKKRLCFWCVIQAKHVLTNLTFRSDIFLCFLVDSTTFILSVENPDKVFNYTTVIMYFYQLVYILKLVQYVL